MFFISFAFFALIVTAVYLYWQNSNNRKTSTSRNDDFLQQKTDEAAKPIGENMTSGEDNEIAFIDLETTGLDHSLDRIIEVGVVVVRLGRKETSKGYSELANPGVQIPQRIVELTGITDEMVAAHHPTGDVVRRFIEHIGHRTVAAYNAKFDIAFLRSEAQRIGLRFDNDYICIMEYTKSRHPNLPRYRLQDVCEAFSIEVEERDGIKAHRAFYDTERATKLFFAVSSGAEPTIFNTPANRKSVNYKELAKYHGIRSAAKEVSEKSKKLEREDINSAISGHNSAIELLIQARSLKIYSEDTDHGYGGDIECLNRLTICLCKAGRAEEAQAAAALYFSTFPQDRDLKSAAQILKRLEKAALRSLNPDKTT